MAERKRESADRLNVAAKIVWVWLLLLDLILATSGIAILVRGSFAGALFALPVAILTRSLVRGSRVLRSNRRQQGRPSEPVR